MADTAWQGKIFDLILLRSPTLTSNQSLAISMAVEVTANTAIDIGERVLDVSNQLIVSPSTASPSDTMILPIAEDHTLQADDELSQPVKYSPQSRRSR